MESAATAEQLSPGKLKVLAVLVAAVILSPILVIVDAVAGAAAGADHVPGGGDGGDAALAAGEGDATEDVGPAAAPASPGAILYASCAACHGPEGQGMAALGGPALAGQEAWYLERQLEAFRAGWRGTHPDDVYGAQMAPMAAVLADEAAIATVAEHIAAMPSVASPDPVAGTADPARGAQFYATCATCHGPEGQGIEQFQAPRLTHQHGWYLERQLANYRTGVRGTHAEDAYGQMMAPMAAMLADDQAVRDVVAYIQSLATDQAAGE